MTPKLGRGAHVPGSAETCVMEYVSIVTGDIFTDLPNCTDPAIAYAAQAVNDASNDNDRQRLLELVPRLATAHRLHSLEARLDLAEWMAKEWTEFYSSSADLRVMEPASPHPASFPFIGKTAGHLARDITVFKGAQAGYTFLSRLMEERDRLARKYDSLLPQYQRITHPPMPAMMPYAVPAMLDQLVKQAPVLTEDQSAKLKAELTVSVAAVAAEESD